MIKKNIVVLSSINIQSMFLDINTFEVSWRFPATVSLYMYVLFYLELWSWLSVSQICWVWGNEVWLYIDSDNHWI